MRKFFFTIFFIAAAVIISRNTFVSPCDKPIAYKIDVVDPKFKLSREKFVESTKSAAEIWNKAYGKELFSFNPDGKLSINLIYDERARLNAQISSLEGQVKKEEKNLNPQIAKYEQDVTIFKQKLAALNAEIQKWNSQGGAPEDVYESLKKRQQELQIEADNLNATAKSLKLATQTYNAKIDNLNQAVDVFNKSLSIRPEEGIFKGPENKIEIYFNNSPDELVHTLAHEMGHALGMEHNENSRSMMYYQTNESLVLSNEDKDSLIQVCKKHSVFEIFVERLREASLRLENMLQI